MDALQELQEKKNGLAAEIKTLGDRQDEWEAEDREKWDTLNADYDSVVEEMQSVQERADVAARLARIEEGESRRQHARRTEIGEARENRAGNVTEEHRALALQAWMRHNNGMDVTERHDEACQLTGLNFRRSKLSLNRRMRQAPQGFQMWANNRRAMKPNFEDTQIGHSEEEARALSVGTPTAGGHTVPEGFSNELERNMLAFGGPRQVARVVTTSTGNDLPWPTSDDTSNSGELLAESASIGSSTDPSFGVVTFNAYKYSSKPVLVSEELLEDSAFNMAMEIARMLGERIGRITSAHFTTGTGTSQPNGLVTASSLGVTAAGATAITGDELIDLQDSIDPDYESFASVGWMFKKSTLTAIRKLKDGNSQYLWQPGLRAGEPDMLLGAPYTINQGMPAIATGLKSILYGAFEKYIIRDVATVRFYRLEERYRDNDQTGFVMFSRHDGDLLDAGTAPIKHLIQA